MLLTWFGCLVYCFSIPRILRILFLSRYSFDRCVLTYIVSLDSSTCLWHLGASMNMGLCLHIKQIQMDQNCLERVMVGSVGGSGRGGCERGRRWGGWWLAIGCAESGVQMIVGACLRMRMGWELRVGTRQSSTSWMRVREFSVVSTIYVFLIIFILSLSIWPLRHLPFFVFTLLKLIEFDEEVVYHLPGLVLMI